MLHYFIKSIEKNIEVCTIGSYVYIIISLLLLLLILLQAFIVDLN